MQSKPTRYFNFLKIIKCHLVKLLSFYASANVKSLQLEKRTFYQSTDNNGVIFTFVTSSKSGTKKRSKC